MGVNKRVADRVRFDAGYGSSIADLDGSWQRRCFVDDVSQTGARITVVGSIERLDLGELLLVLSTTGPIRRRCEMAWTKGDVIGVRLIQPRPVDEAAERRRRRLGLANPPPSG